MLLFRRREVASSVRIGYGYAVNWRAAPNPVGVKSNLTPSLRAVTYVAAWAVHYVSREALPLNHRLILPSRSFPGFGEKDDAEHALPEATSRLLVLEFVVRLMEDVAR